jgi:hypothetical protein
MLPDDGKLLLSATTLWLPPTFAQWTVSPTFTVIELGVKTLLDTFTVVVEAIKLKGNERLRTKSFNLNMIHPPEMTQVNILLRLPQKNRPAARLACLFQENENPYFFGAKGWLGSALSAPSAQSP